ncbi:glycosyltransferase family 39 protein [Humibacter albus]|uniref:glycosyltransferase family 39 protein n=1 Tax=Humibacter albus TaxID=427754 RepID=UPI0003B3F595|nr:glycosyltransferase family 39 protein [Humibacter albus]
MLQFAVPLAAPSVPRADRRSLPVVALVSGVVAALIALLGSWVPSLWGDEAASLLSAKRPLSSLFMMLGHVDAVHGTYYVLLHLWIGLVGTSPFAIRLPSAIAIGIGAAAVVWMCGRLGTMRLAIVAGAVAAVLPRLTYAGEETRAYAFDAAIAAVLCAVVAEIALRRRRTRRLWVVYAVVLAVGTYMFLYVALMAVAIGVFLLLIPDLRAQLRAWAVGTAAAAVAASPVIVFALAERGQVAYLAHRTEVTTQSVLVQMWFWSWPFAVTAWALIVVAIIAAVLGLRRRRGRTEPVEARVLLVALSACWLVIPIGLLVASSPIIAGFTARYGTFAALAAAVLMACGTDALGRRAWWNVVATAVVVALAVPVWMGQRTAYAMNQSDWDAIAVTVETHARARDGIVFDESSRPSRRTRLAMDTDPDAFTSVADLTLRSSYPHNPTWHDTAYTVTRAADLGRFAGVDRVWIVEYSIVHGSSRHTDTWGIGSLERLGYHETARYPNHRSVVYLFTR